MNSDSEMERRIADTIARASSRIRALRRERGLTVQGLADRCEMERSNLCRIEAGRTNMTLRTLCTVCFAMEVELSDLLAEERTDAAESARKRGK